jgi:hypothetical protein
VRGELVGGPGGVGAHQHRHPALLIPAAQRLGQLRQHRVEHRDVIDCGVRPGLARAPQLGHRLAGTAGAVINEPEQRVVTESPPVD